GDHALPRRRPGNGEGTSDFLGDIACLIIGQMILAPEFEGLGDDPIERSRFRLCRWSTHMRAFSWRMGCHKLAIPPEMTGGISHSTDSTKLAWHRERDKRRSKRMETTPHPPRPVWEHRLQAVLALLSGEPVPQVTARFGMGRSILYKWRH